MIQRRFTCEVRNTRRRFQNATNRAVAIVAPLVVAGLSFQRTACAFNLPDTFDVELSTTPSNATTEFPPQAQALNPNLTIPDVPGKTYDAADTADTGTIWNSFVCPNNPSDPSQTIREGATIVDSHGNPSSVDVSVYVQNSGFQLLNENPIPFTVSGAGSDGLAANPGQLMSQGWEDPDTNSEIFFDIIGLPSLTPVTVYLYGSGPAPGDGASFYVNNTLTTENNSSAIYRSVFDSSGTNPSPEQGLSWVETSNAETFVGGGLGIVVMADSSTGAVGSVNGFQIQVMVPEPGCIGSLLPVSTVLAFRRRRKTNLPRE